MFNQKIVKNYQKTKPELQKVKTDLSYAEDDLKNILMKDAQYNAAISNYQNLTPNEQRQQKRALEATKEDVTKKLSDTDVDFQKLLEISQKLKSAINRMTLGFIANDYLNEKKTIPIDWIPQKHIDEILELRPVRLANRKVKNIETQLSYKQ